MKTLTNIPAMTAPIVPTECKPRTLAEMPKSHHLVWSKTPAEDIEMMTPDEVLDMVQNGTAENLASIIMDLATDLTEAREKAQRLSRWRDMYFDIQTRTRKSGAAS